MGKEIVVASMSVILYFCATCNSRSEPIEGEETCSRCGSELATLDSASLHETVMLIPDETAFATETDLDEPTHPQIVHIYQCETLLGAGAMGRVYLARHQVLQRPCALKILSPRVVRDDEDYVARFHNEGRTAASLVHPHVITTHAIGEHEGYHFLEMEFIAGASLQNLINREGALTPLRATRMAAQIADGLGHAHSNGIIHSDLKADNVLLTPQGIPKIADFGLAKQIRADNPAIARKLVGTPNYMAPELFVGTPPNKQSDVYALGVCYFLMLTGRLPFTASTLVGLQQVVANDPLPSLRKLAPDMTLEMAECLSLLLSKAPGNRPRDGIEAAQLLRAVLGEARDLESLLLEAFGDSSDVSWSREDLRYTVDLKLPDGRKQRLYVEPSHHRTTEKLLLIYSTCCSVTPDYFEQALRMNAEMLHGAIAIREIEERDYFVMVDTYPRGTIDVEELRRSVLEVGFRADEIEHRLTGEDTH